MSTQEKETRHSHSIDCRRRIRWEASQNTIHPPTHTHTTTKRQSVSSVNQFISSEREREVTIGPSPSSSSFLIGVNIGRPHRRRRPKRKKRGIPQDCQPSSHTPKNHEEKSPGIWRCKFNPAEKCEAPISPPLPKSEVKCLACGLALALAWLRSPR